MGSNTKLFWKYIRNYCGITLLVTLLLIPVYYTVYSSARDIIIGNARSNLEAVTMDLDNRISQMENFSDLICQESNVKKIAAIDGKPAVEDYFSLRKGSEAVSTAQLFITDERGGQYVIFRNNDVVLSNAGALSDTEIQNYEYYVPQGEDFSTWKEQLFRDPQKIQYFSQQTILWENQKQMNAIMCITKGPGLVEGYDVASIFLLDTNSWGDGLKNPRKDFLYMMDNSGQMLFQAGNTENIPPSFNGIENNIRINGSRYTILEKQCPQSGLSVVVGISNQTIRNQISSIHRLIGLYLILALLGILIFCAWFAAQKAVRMQRLLRSLRRKDSLKRGVNEYDYISTAVREILNDNDNYRQQLDEMKNSIRNSLLERMLVRGIYSRQEENQARTYLGWDMEYYCVICVRAEENNEDCSGSFYIINQYLKKYLSCISVIISMNEQAYIVRMDGSDSPDTENVEDILKGALTSVSGLQAGISSIGTGLENLQQCYEQASWVIQWASQGNSKIRVYRSDRDFSWNQSLYGQLKRYNLNDRLSDILLLGEENGIHEIFNKIHRIIERSSGYTEQEIMQLFCEIRMPLVRMWEELNIEAELVNYEPRESIFKLLKKLENSSCLICARVKAEKAEKENSRKKSMVAFVDEHYMDSQMCVAYVADEFGISEKYFMKSFEEEAGQSFSGYIEKKRLSLAENYLLNTNENAGKIAAMVGYNTVDAFYKAFRKNYGMAPGKWRESKKKL